MTHVYLSLKKRIFLTLSAVIGFMLPFLGGVNESKTAHADTPVANQFSPAAPCPSGGDCCSG